MFYIYYKTSLLLDDVIKPRMKILIQILAFYMLVIFSLPCSDGGFGIVDIVQHLTDIGCNEDITHQHSGDCENHECPPFCVCSCCSMAIDIPTKSPFLFKYFSTTPVKLPVSLCNFNPISFHHSIWQPPRFS